jgi:ArsR family transcriptional regulator, arsenate/arsenite/antimonite-responsive transcriptional repressor
MSIEHLFKGLADQTRLRILNLLLTGELCGCDLQYVLDTSQPNISRHLSYLKRTGLVLDRRDGYRVFYRVADAENPNVSLLAEYLRQSFRMEKGFERDLRTLKVAIKDGACTVSEVPSQLSTGRKSLAPKVTRTS